MQRLVGEKELTELFRHKLSNITYAWSKMFPQPLTDFAKEFCINFSKGDVEKLVALLEQAFTDVRSLDNVNEVIVNCLNKYNKLKSTESINPENLQTLLRDTETELQTIVFKNENINTINDIRSLREALFKAQRELAYQPEGVLKQLFDQPPVLLTLSRWRRELETLQTLTSKLPEGREKRSQTTLIAALNNLIIQAENFKNDPATYAVIKNIVSRMIKHPNAIEAQKIDAILHDREHYKNRNKLAENLQTTFEREGLLSPKINAFTVPEKPATAKMGILAQPKTASKGSKKTEEPTKTEAETETTEKKF